MPTYIGTYEIPHVHKTIQTGVSINHASENSNSNDKLIGVPLKMECQIVKVTMVT